MGNSNKKFKNVVVSVEEPGAPVEGQVCDVKILWANEVGGVLMEHREFAFPAGRVQQQQKYVGTNNLWVNVGPEQTFSAPTTFGADVPLNANTAVQYVWVGA